jgi:glycosyltransferase involved in cell wall biosynthesis
MALIAMAVYDTEENKRSKYTKKTLMSLFLSNIDWKRHRLVIVNNNSCLKTLGIINDFLRYMDDVDVIHLEENVGTARAINKAWSLRKPGEHLVKIDNDVVISDDDWLDKMEDVLNMNDRVSPPIGIIGLKRRDLIETPYREDGYKSQLVQMPHKQGEMWYTVEVVNHCMGTCQMYHHKLIDKIGGLEQLGGIYGLDDTIASYKSQLAGFCNAFMVGIDIDHIDTGENTDYLKFKSDYVSTKFPELNRLFDDYKTGRKELFTPIE